MSARLRHYACGSTTHDPAALFRGGDRGIRTFPSGVFLFDDGSGRRVLFDTGYATGEWCTGWKGSVYRRLLPPIVTEDDDVAVQLLRDGIDPDSITHVVLSHLHPDHIGGAHRFPDATFVLSAGQLRSLSAPRMREGILSGLLPTWFDTADRIVVDDDDFVLRAVGGHPVRTTDLLGDGSYLVLDLPGHARGHLGALVAGRVLLAGDAAWGSDLLHAADHLKPIPRRVQHDVAAYRETARTLRAIVAAGVRVVCSHDAVVDKELLP